MSIHEFADPIPVDTPLGRADALFVEASGHEQYWTCVIYETRAIVSFKQRYLKLAPNYTAQRGQSHDEMKRITALTMNNV
jgi:hypothetical protein